MTATGPTTTSEASEPRAKRADAVINRQRILEAAEAVFAAEGVHVPIDRVAERAGVGVGTVYRHFPTKEDLFEAIVVTRMDELLVAARAQAAATEPGRALLSYVQHFARHASSKRDLFDALGAAGIDFKERCSDKVGEMKQCIGLLLARRAGRGFGPRRHLGRRAAWAGRRDLPGG